MKPLSHLQLQIVILLHAVRSSILYSINAFTNKITSYITLSSNTQFLKGVGEIIMPFCIRSLFMFIAAHYLKK